MKSRKPMFASGVILTIIASLFFALMVVLFGVSLYATIAIGTIDPSEIEATSEFLNSQQLQTLVDFFASFGELIFTVLTITVAVLLVVALLLLISSTRFIKYSSASNEQFNRKKPTLVLSVICVLIAIAFQIFGVATSFDIFTLVLAIVEVICIVLVIVAIAKEPKTKKAVAETVQNQNKVFEQRPSIYTSGLDDEETAVQEETQTEQQEIEKPNVKETPASKQLVDAIGELDKMRKEGAITPTEYTRLRGQLIRKYIK